MSWEQLADIRRQDSEEARRTRSEPPTACPLDGTPLEVRSDGIRNCPMGNYRWGG